MKERRPWVAAIATTLSLAYLTFLLVWCLTTVAVLPHAAPYRDGSPNISRPIVFNVLCVASIVAAWALWANWKRDSRIPTVQIGKR